MASRSRLTSRQVHERMDAVNALSDLSGACHQGAVMVIMGADPAAIRAKLASIREQLGRAEKMPGIATTPSAERPANP